MKSFIIGRKTDKANESVNLELEDSTVSRLHAKLSISAEGKIYLEDRDSLNGTAVKNEGKWIPLKAMTTHQIHPGAVVRFGSTELSIMQVIDRLLEAHPPARPVIAHYLPGLADKMLARWGGRRKALADEKIKSVPPVAKKTGKPRFDQRTGEIVYD